MTKSADYDRRLCLKVSVMEFEVNRTNPIVMIWYEFHYTGAASESDKYNEKEQTKLIFLQVLSNKLLHHR